MSAAPVRAAPSFLASRKRWLSIKHFSLRLRCDTAIKISPTLSLPNYLNARENGVVNIDVRRGTNRTDTQISLEEAFGEVKLADVSANFDFVSARVGIQPFVSDFRGFIFS